MNGRSARAGAAVGIISKLPRLGHSKTRLARSLGAEAALALHRAFLDDELEQLRRPERWELYLVHDMARDRDEAARLAAQVRGRARSLVPAASGLAAELLGAFRILLREHERAVIVSADVPHLDPDAVARALSLLDDADLVLGPGPDGGYWLIGLREPHDLFSGVTMGTGGVEKATAARARRMGLAVGTVGAMTDLDEAQDLIALDQAPPHLARSTREVVAGLRREEIAYALPSELQIEVTSRCNLKCTACLRSHVDLAPEADLRLADYRAVVRELPRLERVAFQLNGEPLLCEDVFSMVEEAAGGGAHTVLNTNGVGIRGRRAEALLDCGLDELRVSVDGARPETVRRMTGVDLLPRLVRQLTAFSEARAARGAGRPRIGLWMVATRETFGELPDLVRLAARVGADEVYVQRLVLTGHGMATRAHSLFGRVDGSIRRVVAEAERVAAETGVALRASGRRPILESLRPTEGPNPCLGCWRPWRSAVVTASRLVLPCCISSFVVDYETLTRGDLKDQSWPEIWNGPRYRGLRRGILRGDPEPCCARCGLEWSL